MALKSSYVAAFEEYCFLIFNFLEQIIFVKFVKYGWDGNEAVKNGAKGFGIGIVMFLT